MVDNSASRMDYLTVVMKEDLLVVPKVVHLANSMAGMSELQSVALRVLM